MSIHKFLSNLDESGHVVVSAESDYRQPPAVDYDDMLNVFDGHMRQQLAYEAPAFDRPAARWAAAVLYRACQFTAFRDVDADTVNACLHGECPGDMGPPVVYSVDLTFRFLPDVLRLARGIALDDPLNDGLRDIGRRWPLSSVGMTGVDDVSVDSFIENPCLSQLYVDRIIAAGAQSRLKDARVQAAVQRALGDYHELAPALAHAAVTDAWSKDDE